MRKSTAILLSASSFLAGAVIGFLLAPIKKGVSIGCNSGNQNCRNNRCGYDDCDFDECSDDLDDEDWMSCGPEEEPKDNSEEDIPF